MLDEVGLEATDQMNWGKILAGLMAIESLAASIGFLAAGDRTKAAYWFFAACINSTFVF